MTRKQNLVEKTGIFQVYSNFVNKQYLPNRCTQLGEGLFEI